MSKLIMKIIILKNKVTFVMLRVLFVSLFPLCVLSESLIDDQFKSNMLLCFSPKNIIKKSEEIYQLNVAYLGNIYECNISSHFGGQLILKDWNIQNKYYVVVSDQVDLLLDNNSCIKGYKVNPDNINNAKMYAMYLIVTVNEKNTMTYNWNIEEMPIPQRSLPDNTIIIYCHPSDISFTAFDKKFDKTYPNITNENSSMIILPQASYDSQNLFIHSLKNNCLEVNTVAGHKKITQSIK